MAENRVEVATSPENNLDYAGGETTLNDIFQAAWLKFGPSVGHQMGEDHPAKYVLAKKEE